MPEADEQPMWHGPRADELDALATSGGRIKGDALQGIADGVRQAIWGSFEGFDDQAGGTPWVRITAFDSSWFDVECAEAALIERLRDALAGVPTPSDAVVLRLGSISSEVNEMSLLVWGNEDGLLLFRDFLRQLPPNGEWRSLEDIPGFVSSDGTRLMAAGPAAGLTSLKERGPEEPGSWRWVINRAQVPSFVAKVEIVASIQGRGHHYLDSDEPGDGTVIVSKGEYPDNFRP